ncbi:Hypothetical Protein FCC1311_101512 [Hondaea fermentalgiana]|uniref:Uncharacterized protein n=1 Tax=Hondaea fermentalgiana TaxID=2315210 RepID=A0A2R5GVY6_9STRA|nr:Hypothetical Protein FCC1311_101512 [Hondaea fermentalgiana]|eukprot:GBG33928.1 Hypothetical Protein FCC1311_101512 [Hondaea fermentalgiana]
MGDYTAPTYVAPSVLEMLHNSPRVRGSSEFNFPTAGFALSQDDPTVEYVIGISAGPIAAFIVFIIWVFALCCIGCCREKCCNRGRSNKVGAIFFVGFMVLSCFGWFYSLGANTQALNGLDTVLGTGKSLQDFVDETDTTLAAAADTATGVLDTIEVAAVTCQNLTETANITFPETDWDDFADSIDDSLDGVTGEMDEVVQQFNDVVETIDPYLEKVRVGYKVTVALIIVISAVFTIATLYRLYTNAPGSGTRPAKALAGCSGTFFIVLSVIMLLLLWIVIVVLAIISTAGADFCVPSPTSNLNRLLSDMLLQDDPGADLCSTDPYSYLCYYQTCEGTNPLTEAVGDTSNITDVFEASIDELLTTLNETINNATEYGYPVENGTECIAAVEDIQTSIGEIPGAIDSVVDVADCSNINPMYVDLLAEGTCNGVTAGFAIMWVTLTLGSVSLMAAIIVYRCFEFDRFENGEYVMAEAVAVGNADGPPPKDVSA